MGTFGTIEQAIEDLRNGKIVIVADDEDRENEGDFVCAAELVTPETINFMTLHGRGLICLALTGERCDQLGLPQMTERNTEELATAFTVSIDAERRFGVTTGISARDRATTIHVAINPATVPSDLRRPGHIFPLRARPGGVLQRVGQTEASVDLARLAGLIPAGVICEILNPDGSMARRPELHEMARQHNLTFITVAQLVAYRLRTEQLVHRVAEARVPTDYGEFRLIGYQNDVDRAEHVALVHGEESAVYGDQAYWKEADRQAFEARGVRYRVNRRANDRKRGLNERWRAINRARSRTRACGEHAFHIVKRLWGFTKVRYRGLAKNLARAQTMFALANLYMVRRRLLPAGTRCAL